MKKIKQWLEQYCKTSFSLMEYLEYSFKSLTPWQKLKVVITLFFVLLLIGAIITKIL